MNLEASVINIFRIIFPSLENISDENLILFTSDEIVEWDSLTKVNLITVLEQEFGVAIDDEFAYNVNSVIEVVDYLDQLISD